MVLQGVLDASPARAWCWGQRGGADGGGGYSSSPPGVARSCPEPIPHRDQHALCISRTHPDDASTLAHELHVPALFVASQGDCRGRSQRRWRLSVWPRFPLPVLLRSRNLSKRGPQGLEASNECGGGAVSCAFSRQPGGRAAVLNLGFSRLCQDCVHEPGSECITDPTLSLLDTYQPTIVTRIKTIKTHIIPDQFRTTNTDITIQELLGAVSWLLSLRGIHGTMRPSANTAANPSCL